MNQPRWQSAVESVANISIGFGVAVGAQIAVFPMFGFHPPLADNLLLGAIFTVVSLIRSFALRRLFNRWHHGKEGNP
mgnify:CR=1 FL=1